PASVYFIFSPLFKASSTTKRSLSLALSLSLSLSNLVSLVAISGNQREKDRERAQARAGKGPKQPRDDGLTPEQRRERDAKALQEKAARKAAQANAGNGNNPGDTK
ncbi:hypothetical protein NMG60_11014233, partial [Bertholletia excelsa]